MGKRRLGGEVGKRCLGGGWVKVGKRRLGGGWVRDVWVERWVRDV